MKKILIAIAALAGMMANAAVVRTAAPTYIQVAGVSNQVLAADAKLDALAGAISHGVTPGLQNIQATLEALKIEFAKNRIATLTIRLNPPGSDYEIPTNATEYAELLDGAYLVFNQQGIATPTIAHLETLTNAVWQQTLYCTDASAAVASSCGAKLGDSATCGYAVATQYTRLKDGDSITVDLTTHKVVGEHAQICRVQPYSTNANGASNSGESYIAVKTLTPTGTVWRSGQYVDGLWQDGSLVKTVIWDCPGDQVNERILEDGGSADSIDLMQTLNVLRNLKIVYADFTGGSANILSNQFVRFDKVYIKTVREPVPVKVTSNNTTSTVYVDSVVKYFCDEKLDADYHLPGAFERYERQADDSIAATSRDHAYIARYPIQFQTITVDGASQPIPRSLPDSSTEVGATRSTFLARCRAVTNLTVTIHAPGEPDVVIPAKSDPRAVSLAGMNDDALLQTLAYLLLGANPQASLPGRMTATGVSSTKNGQSDYMVAKGVWNGAWDTTQITNTIVCMGVEDGTWSSTGWMWPDVTSLSKRVMLTDSTGAVTNGAPLVDGWIYALDRLDYNPCDSTANYNNVTTTEDALLAAGYSWTEFQWGVSGSPNSGMKRLGYENVYGLRDAFLPSNTGGDNIKVGSDGIWHTLQAAPANYSASTAYAAGALCYYDGKLYSANTAMVAGTWNASNWDLQTSREVVSRSWFMFARGYYRAYGAYLGLGCVNAYNALSSSGGNSWRGRLSLQP